MKKRLLPLLLVLAMCLSGCGGGDEPVEPTPATVDPGPDPAYSETDGPAHVDLSGFKLDGYQEEEFHDDDLGWTFDTTDTDVVWGDLYSAEDRKAGWAFTVPVFTPGDSVGKGIWRGYRLSSYGEGLFCLGAINELADQNYVDARVTALHGEAFDFSDDIDKETTTNWEKRLSDFEMEVSVAVRDEDPGPFSKTGADYLYWAKYPTAEVRAIQMVEHDDVKAGWMYGGYVWDNEFRDDDWIGSYIFHVSRQLDDGHWLTLRVDGDWGNDLAPYLPADMTDEQKDELWAVFQSTCQKLARLYGMGDAADILPSGPVASYRADDPTPCPYDWLTAMIEEGQIA